jgi:hypothetical protein
METYTYDSQSENLQEAIDAHRKGGIILCSKCGAELMMLLDRESATKNHLPTGIYCPNSQKHICVVITTTEHFEEFDRLFPRKE